MGTGTDVAIEAERPHVRPRRTQRGDRDPAVAPHPLRVIQQNLFWAFAYNVAAINPMIAGAATAARRRELPPRAA